MTDSQSFSKLQRHLQTVRALIPKSLYSQDNATNVMAPENEIIDSIYHNELYFPRNISFIHHCLENFLESTNSQNEECVKKCLHILQKMSEEKKILSVNGKYCLYYRQEDGKPRILKESGLLYNNHERGVRRYYNRNGFCTAKISIKNHQCTSAEYYDLPSSYTLLRTGARTGIFENKSPRDFKEVHLFRNGKVYLVKRLVNLRLYGWKVWQKIPYSKDQRNGMYKLFQVNGPNAGKTLAALSFRSGNLDGKSRLYDTDGSLQIMASYKRDEVHGMVKIYTKSKYYGISLRQQVSFFQGKKHGKALFYSACPMANENEYFSKTGLSVGDEDKNYLNEIRTYKNGVLHGATNYYHYNNLKRTINYEQGFLNGLEKIFELDEFGAVVAMSIKKWKNGIALEEFVEAKNSMNLRLLLETKNENLLKKIPISYLRTELEKKDLACKTSWTKKKLLDLYQNLEKKENIACEAVDDSEENIDLFGNVIENPVIGNDGGIYDLKSMEYLFEKNNDSYVRIRGGHYESGIWVVDYPRMNQGKPLSKYFNQADLKNQEMEIENRNELLTLFKNRFNLSTN
jgi:antitoxin component YwqK of YwqJK toxin-antitoxin module